MHRTTDKHAYRQVYTSMEIDVHTNEYTWRQEFNTLFPSEYGDYGKQRKYVFLSCLGCVQPEAFKQHQLNK